MKNTVLVTGADGYIGSRIVARLLQDPTRRIVAAVRARDSEELRSKEEKIRNAFPRGLSVVSADLTKDEPLRDLEPTPITAIFHAAAVPRFNVDRPTAESVNIEGTRKVVAFAKRCKTLERLVLLSTVYACGLRTGRIDEAPLTEASAFANHYEWSKWRAEQVLIQEASGLPWQIHRLSTVIADDASGHVIQQNALHNTLKLLYYGLLSIIPGRPETRLFFVTGEDAVNGVVALNSKGQDRKVYHVTAPSSHAPRLGDMIDWAFEAFAASPEFSRRRILRPLFADVQSFELLADGVRSFGGDILNQSLASVAPFSKQLFLDKDVRNERFSEAVGGFAPPDPHALVTATCRNLVSTRWGREVPIAT